MSKIEWLQQEINGLKEAGLYNNIRQQGKYIEILKKIPARNIFLATRPVTPLAQSARDRVREALARHVCRSLWKTSFGICII